ncbi:MAG: hypothetical protein HY911_05605 [Desulfobacterales bacterium]|nr:hypothetical protein [Desulfobacterales bacterium]
MIARWLAWIALGFLSFTGPAAGDGTYTVDAAFEAIGPPGKGLQSGYEMADFLGRLLLDAELDAQTAAFFDFWQQSIRQFDMQALYQAPYLTGTDNGFRSAVFHGRNLPDKCVIRLNHQDIKVQDALAHLGNFGVAFSLKQKKSELKDKNCFEAKIDAQMALKQFTHGAVAAWIDGMQQVIDPKNIARLASPRAEVFDDVTGEARKPIDNYYELFPAQTRFFDRYVQLKAFIALESCNGRPYTCLALEMAPRLPAFEKDFKHLHAYFMKVKGVLGLSLRLKTLDGLNITSCEVDTRTHSFFWRFNTRQGKLIPFNDAGEPVFSREFSLTEIDQYRMNAIASGRINLYGVRVNSGEAIARIDYRRRPDGAAFDLRVVEIPTPEIRGRALGVVPLFLVDAMIPSNIEDLAHEFVTVMANGNNGQGSGMKIDWDESRPMDAVMRLQAHTELLDNRFVNIALRLWGRRIHPDPATLEEIARFWGLFFRTMLPEGAM